MRPERRLKMDERSKVFSELAECILVDGAYKATKYINEKLTIKATRKRYKGKRLWGHAIDIIFTVGKPNYEEREFIKMCKKAGEPFPVKKMQVKFPK
jgi:wobble nucleotide-excising tRNase